MTEAVEFNEKEKVYFKKMFDLFDTDKSGAIGFFEMKNLSKHLGVELPDDVLRASIKNIDAKTGEDLEFPDFLRWLLSNQNNGDVFAPLKAKIRAQGSRNLTNSQIEQLRLVFNHFDTDHSGSIDVDELGRVFDSMGQNLAKEELESMIVQVDDDGSGEIEFEEFMLLMCSNFGNQRTFDQEMLEEFQQRDPKLTGIIMKKVLKEMIKDLSGPYLTDAEIEDILASADDHDDGTPIQYMKWEALWEACRSE